VQSLGDTFGWPFRDPSWLSKLAVQGLIWLIPVVGWIAALGWMLEALDSARSGRHELPPAGFPLRRGIGLFGAVLVWYLVLYIPYIALIALSVVLRDSGVAVVLTILAALASLLAGLLFAFLYPSLVLHTDRGGFGGGLRFGGVLRTATANPSGSLVAGLMVILAGLIGGLGFILCFVGIAFTYVYGLAMTAGVVAWFERQVPQPSAAASPGFPEIRSQESR